MKWHPNIFSSVAQWECSFHFCKEPDVPIQGSTFLLAKFRGPKCCRSCSRRGRNGYNTCFCSAQPDRATFQLHCSSQIHSRNTTLHPAVRPGMCKPPRDPALNTFQRTVDDLNHQTIPHAFCTVLLTERYPSHQILCPWSPASS